MAGDPRLGENVDDQAPDAMTPAMAPWIDAETASYIDQVIALMRELEPHTLAAILFGSVARHEERPQGAPHPSDVDILILLEPEPGQDELTHAQHHALSSAVVRAWERYPNPAREVQVFGALTHFHHWDESFVDNLAREAILLWSRGPLPTSLRPAS